MDYREVIGEYRYPFISTGKCLIYNRFKTLSPDGFPKIPQEKMSRGIGQNARTSDEG
jgi:hypothetical protein